MLNRLCEALKIEPTVKENGSVALVINEKLEVDARTLDPGVLFEAQICPLPSGKKEEILTLLMKANYLGQGTLGGSIGLTFDEKNLTLSSVFPYDMNERGLKNAVEDFVNIVDFWRSEIDQLKNKASGIL